MDEKNHSSGGYARSQNGVMLRTLRNRAGRSPSPIWRGAGNMIGTYQSSTRTTAVLAALIFAVGMLSLASARPSEAAFPGTNGKISFTSTRDGDQEIYTMNA